MPDSGPDPNSGPNSAPRYPNDVVASTNRDISPENRRWHTVARIADAPAENTTQRTVPKSQIDSEDDIAMEVLVESRVVAVFRHAGQWFALDGMCSHQGGPLAEGVVRDGCVTCPWHGWQYDLATGIQMINQQPLQESFPVRLVEDRIEISID
ncbi:Rieske (2Fe-2S) protein [Rhodopirellula sallentina]|uniref:Rieske (2Fe-2S) protein n=1 Tax=Rhodopirellula sallentina TaxID=1263869 RepID=UPI0009D937DB|nr:Rieske (2Fe-2S) protein [Rhodopirellula sallentina]